MAPGIDSVVTARPLEVKHELHIFRSIFSVSLRDRHCTIFIQMRKHIILASPYESRYTCTCRYHLNIYIYLWSHAPEHVVSIVIYVYICSFFF